LVFIVAAGNSHSFFPLFAFLALWPFGHFSVFPPLSQCESDGTQLGFFGFKLVGKKPMDPTENLKKNANPKKKLHNASKVIHWLTILATCGISLNTNLMTANKQQGLCPQQFKLKQTL